MITSNMAPSMKLGGEFTDFEELLNDRFPSVKTVKKGEAIVKSRTDGPKVNYYLKSGVVNARLLLANGDFTELGLRESGTIFPLFYSQDSVVMARPFDVVAVQDCILLIIPRQELRALLLEIPAFSMAMIDAYAQFATNLQFLINGRLHDTLFTRVCDFLYLHMDKKGTVLATQDAIAAVTGGSRSKISEALGRLYNEAIIETRRGGVIVVNPAKLKDNCSLLVQDKDK